jgi:hypothetical protein
MKMITYWDMRRVVSLKKTDVSDVVTASIIRAIALKLRSTSTRLHGAIFQKAIIFILAPVRTRNVTYKRFPTKILYAFHMSPIPATYILL